MDAQQIFEELSVLVDNNKGQVNSIYLGQYLYNTLIMSPFVTVERDGVLLNLHPNKIPMTTTTLENEHVTLYVTYAETYQFKPIKPTYTIERLS